MSTQYGDAALPHVVLAWMGAAGTRWGRGGAALCTFDPILHCMARQLGSKDTQPSPALRPGIGWTCSISLDPAVLLKAGRDMPGCR